MTKPLEGILSALATPFTDTDTIDVQRLRELVDRNINAGVHAVVAGGSTGEFAAMSHDERRLLVETVVGHTSGRVPVVAQTGAVSTKEALELTRHAEDCGADVVMVVAPYYEALTVPETMRYLRTVASATRLPVMLYNIPAATGVNLTPDLVRELATDVENILYIKDTTGDLNRFAQLVHHHGDVISSFIGWDRLALAALVEGGAGVVAGTANVIPNDLVHLYRLIEAGELKEAQTLWSTVFPVIDAMLDAPFIAAVKYACREIGFPLGSPRLPVADLDAAALDSITSALKTLDLEAAR